MKLSDSEWKVMQALWDLERPASTRDVLERVAPETGWAYTTVKTLLTRLKEKDVVSEAKRQNTSWYQPRLTQRQARRSALRSLVDRAFDGTFGSLVHHLLDVEKLGKKERERLQSWLDEVDEESVER